MRIAIKGKRGPKKNLRAKTRNAARKQFRRDNPEYRGSKLHCWPLPGQTA